MKVLFKVLLVLTTSVLGAIAYAALRGQMQKHDNGWDGIASALENLFVGLIIFAIMGFVLTRTLPDNAIKWLSIVLTILSLGLLTTAYLKMNAEKKAGQEQFEKEQQRLKTKIPTVVADAYDDEKPPSEGIAKIIFGNKHSIPLLFSQTTDGHTVYSVKDSLVINERWDELSYAPAYFVPFYSKPDYQLLYLQATARTDKAIEVIINEKTGQRTFIAPEDVEFMDWPMFILRANSVDIKRPGDNLLRPQPLSHTEPMTVSSSASHFQPFEIDGKWLHVHVLDDQGQRLQTGWIQWLMNGQIAVDVNPLS
jgi:hypothetical protein